MFDFSFGELLLLAVVALLVLGPERLPKVARLAGLWIRKARAQWNSVKAELENELADEELRRSLREASDAMRDGMQQVRTLPDAVRADLTATDLTATQPTTTDTATVMRSLDHAQRALVQAVPDSDAPNQLVPGSDKRGLDRTVDSTIDSASPEQLRSDPTQLSLLEPDQGMRMTQMPPENQPHSDGEA